MSHVCAWMYGAIIMLISMDWHAPPTYSGDYLTHTGCQANMTFLLTDDKKECLLSGERCQMFQFFYGQFFALEIFSVLIFGITVYVAYQSYRKNMVNKDSPDSLTHQSLGLNSSLYSSNNFDIAADQSYIIFKTTFRFAVTSFAYLILLMPIIGGQLYQANNGPFQNKNLRVVYGVCFSIVDSSVAIINILFYGVFSPLFRKELRAMIARHTRRTYQQTCVCFCCINSNQDFQALPAQRVPREPVFGMSTSLQNDDAT